MRSENLVLGIDEAGRGPVLGPIVVSGVEIRKGVEEELMSMGVRDSKDLTLHQIKRLVEDIKKVAENIYVEILHPNVINYRMHTSSLNEIEFKLFSNIVKKSHASKVYVDAFSSNAKRLEMQFKNMFSDVEFVVEHKADSKYVVVGAASIIAKYYREKEMDVLREKYSSYGDIGSGYSSDDRTIKFIKQYYEKEGSFPPETRTKWSTIDNIKKKKKQKKLY